MEGYPLLAKQLQRIHVFTSWTPLTKASLAFNAASYLLKPKRGGCVQRKKPIGNFVLLASPWTFEFWARIQVLWKGRTPSDDVATTRRDWQRIAGRHQMGTTACQAPTPLRTARTLGKDGNGKTFFSTVSSRVASCSQRSRPNVSR